MPLFIERKAMGYKSKKYKKDLHQQAYEALTGMLAFGESKKEAATSGTGIQDHIYSVTSYKTYWQHIKQFIAYVNKTHPECKSLKKARKYAKGWLELRESQGYSASTLHTEAKSLGKLFGITPEDKDYYKPPERRRKDITRSRIERSRDRHFSKTNNKFLIRFCKGVGARRSGLTKMRGRDFRTRQQIMDEVERLTEISRKCPLTQKELTSLRINKDALTFDKSEYFVYLREKGGRERISPIVGPDVDDIVARFKETPPDDKVFQHVHSACDVHGYRADYSRCVYKMYCRCIEDIPFDRIHAGTGHKYQSEAYHCRGDEKGRSLDRRAMLMASRALGHNRLDVVAGHYLHGL